MESSLPLIKKIHTSSGIFGDGVDLDLFLTSSNQNNEDVPHRVSVIFGRNGSGKTTLSEEIALIGNASSTKSKFLTAHNDEIDLSNEDRKRIRVFNERYIQEKVLIEENGLESIVMLGDQADAKKRIDEIDKELVELGEKVNTLILTRDKIEKGPNSLDKILSAAKKQAKDGGWTNRYLEITGTKPSMTQTRWEEVCAAETKQSRTKLQQEYALKLDNYKKATKMNEKINTVIPMIDLSRYKENDLVTLLAKELKEPVLNEREQKIFELISCKHQDIVEEAYRIFSEDDVDTCPMCQQLITPEYKASLIQNIRAVFNEEKDAYAAALAAASFATLNEDRDSFSRIPDSILLPYLDELYKANRVISQYNTLIAQRLHSIYTPIISTALGLQKTLESLNEIAANINQETKVIDKIIENREHQKDQLLAINNQIARIDASKEIERYDASVAELETARKDLNDSQRRMNEKKAQRQREEARMHQTTIAAKKINDYLSNIYFDSTRFALVPAGKMYKITSYGEPVLPNDISTGERNALALCYFFSESGKGKFEGAEDADPQYIILDDPISSFDLENKVGIYSLIRERATCILESNTESLITIMTHDASVMTELSHSFDDISKQLNGTQHKFKTDYLELRNRTTTKLILRGSEYSTLLERAYRFAASDQEDTEESYVIGNILRRIMEGYGTFNYALGMQKLARDTDLLERFGQHKRVIAHVMYRLALNNESHMEEKIAALNPSITFEHYSYQEKKLMAQCVFVILSDLDPHHVIKHLERKGLNRNDISNSISEWKMYFTPRDAVQNSE